MKNPLVSVVVIVKNGERFIASALQSVFQQDYSPFEVIVVDGGSSDRTVEITKDFPVQFLVQQNKGISNAYNAGIDASNGELIAFLSHDDIWTCNKLSVQVRYMMENPELQYSLGRAKYFLQEGCLIPRKFKQGLLEGDHLMYGMETLMVRKSLFERTGKFDPEFTTAEDVDWFLRTRDLKIPMGVLDEVILHKRVHDSNASLNDTNTAKLFLKIARYSVQRKRNDEAS